MTLSTPFSLKTDLVAPLYSQFEIVPEDDPQNAIAGSSADACHAELLETISAAM